MSEPSQDHTLYAVCFTDQTPTACPSVGCKVGPPESVHADLATAVSAADAERQGPCGRVYLHGAIVMALKAGERPEWVYQALPQDCPACERFNAEVEQRGLDYMDPEWEVAWEHAHKALNAARPFWASEDDMSQLPGATCARR